MTEPAKRGPDPDEGVEPIPENERTDVELETAEVVAGELVAVETDVIGPPGPGEWRAMREQADVIARTEFVPKEMRGRPDAVLAAILTGREMGLGPMASLQGIRISDGKPAYDAELMRALVRRRGHVLRVIEKTHFRCELYGRRRDTGEEATVVWELADAKIADLIDRIDEQTGLPVARSQNDKPMPWEKYPKRMLFARATSELVSDLFADVLVGGSYTPEELADPALWDEPDTTPPDVAEARARIATAKERGQITGEHMKAAAGELELGSIRWLDMSAEDLDACLTRALAIAARKPDPEPDEEGSPEAPQSTEAVESGPSSSSTAPDDGSGAKLVTALLQAATVDPPAEGWDAGDSGDPAEERRLSLRSIAELVREMDLSEPEVRHVLGHSGRKSVAKWAGAAGIPELRTADDLLAAELERRNEIRANEEAKA